MAHHTRIIGLIYVEANTRAEVRLVLVYIIGIMISRHRPRTAE